MKRSHIIVGCVCAIAAGLATVYGTRSNPMGLALGLSIAMAFIGFMAGLFIVDAWVGWRQHREIIAGDWRDPDRVHLVDDLDAPESLWHEVQSWR
jgi:hypothetical protein